MPKPASYTYLTKEEWAERSIRLHEIAANCELCPRKCRVNRHNGETGFCGAPGEMVISSIFPHHGEEPPISGTNGSGTVFFSHCTLKCAFCQNYQISHEHDGQIYSTDQLAEKLLWLQEQGCHNVNLVTPTHFLPWFIDSLRIASGKGLEIPIVYNCSGYEMVGVLQLLDRIVDIYLPDMKYGNNTPAKRYSKAPDYVEANRLAIKEMFRQVGPLKLDSEGIAYRGLCIRHLVLPNGRSYSDDILHYLQQTYDSSDISMSFMAQYRPLYKAANYKEIDCPLDPQYYDRLRQQFTNAGFEGFYQELPKMDENFLINFKERKSEPLTGK